MPINTATIDAQITKQRDHLKKLEELRRFASDPETAQLLESLIIENGREYSATAAELGAHGEHKPLIATNRVPGRPKGSSSKKRPKKGDLKDGVIKAISSITERFTAPRVVEIMNGDGFRFSAERPNFAVNGVLRKLAKTGTLRVAAEGSGRTPNQYERVL